MHPAEMPPDDLLRDCEIRRSRRRGPGGQHRNKVETAVTIVHTPTGVRAEASERRSQRENLQRAVFRLRVSLAVHVRTDRREPPAIWRSRCHAGRISVNPSHQDFPALLAIALDVLSAHGFEPSLAAKPLGCTSSQLVKLLKLAPHALEAVNSARATRNLPALR